MVAGFITRTKFNYHCLSRAIYILLMYASDNEKSHDPNPSCRRSVEKRLPRSLKTISPHVLATPLRFPLDTVTIVYPKADPAPAHRVWKFKGFIFENFETIICINFIVINIQCLQSLLDHPKKHRICVKGHKINLLTKKLYHVPWF